MSIDKIMMKWFDETDNLINAEINNFESIDGLCIAVLHNAKDYCCAISTLLQCGHIMPAKALLRCICELSMKLFWCLNVPDDTNDQDANALVERKIHQWEKDTLCRNVKTLEEFRDAADGSDKQEIAEGIDNLKSKPLFSDESVKKLPPFKNLIDFLPTPVKKEVYPLLYLQFNNAVHLDVTSLFNGYKEKKGEQARYNPDILKYCLAHALHINGAIRKNYKIDVSDIKQEYHAVMKTLT